MGMFVMAELESERDGEMETAKGQDSQAIIIKE